MEDEERVPFSDHAEGEEHESATFYGEAYEEVERVRGQIEWIISLRPTEYEWELRDRGDSPPYPSEFWKGLEAALSALASALEAVDAERGLDEESTNDESV